jgi:hypothetical protein
MSKMCKVKNRGAGHITYRIPEDGIRRSFAPHETKVISFEELEKLTYQPGGLAILTKYLQAQDMETIKAFNMQVEPEYHMSEQDVANLITSGSLDAFLDALDFAPQGVIDLIKKLSVDIPLVDIQKRKALKEKTGFDVEAAVRHNEEDKEDEQTTILKQPSERRVKAEEVPAGRRTAPKYNIITPKSAETSAE